MFVFFNTMGENALVAIAARVSGWDVLSGLNEICAIVNNQIIGFDSGNLAAG